MAAEHGRYDWITLFFDRGSPLAEERETERIFATLRQLELESDWSLGGWDFGVVAGKTGKDANLQFQVWGKLADLFAEAMPEYYWLSVRRFDYRYELENYSDVEMRALATGAIRKGCTRGNMVILDGKPRTKNNKRDVGGIGVQYGSRKSNKQLVAYKRGRERAACEFRMMNDDCKQFILHAKAFVDHTQQIAEGMYAKVLRLVRDELAQFSTNWLGHKSPEHVFAALIARETEAGEMLEAVRGLTELDNQQTTFWNDAVKYLPDEPGLFDFPACEGCGRPVNKQDHICFACGARF